MKKIKVKHLAVFIAFLIFAFVLDRIIKNAALSFLANDIWLIRDLLKISLSQNVGIAFSIGLPMFIQLLIFPVLFITGLFVIWKYYDSSKLFLQITAGLIAGGAIGNFVDRVYYGFVIDYISVSFFPVFNLADIFIVIGIFLLLVFYGKIKGV